jgi:hypothetical protein
VAATRLAARRSESSKSSDERVASRIELFCNGKTVVNERNMALPTHWRVVSDAQERHRQTVSYSYK